MFPGLKLSYRGANTGQGAMGAAAQKERQGGRITLEERELGSNATRRNASPAFIPWICSSTTGPLSFPSSHSAEAGVEETDGKGMGNFTNETKT